MEEKENKVELSTAVGVIPRLRASRMSRGCSKGFRNSKVSKLVPLQRLGNGDPSRLL